MKIPVLFFLAPSAFVLFSCNNTKDVSLYPETKKTDSVETYFGTAVPDPYQWLENDTLKDTKDWIDAQNHVTFSYLNAIPFKGKLQQRLEQLNNYEKLSAPFREGESLYFYKNTGLQNHSVLYRKKGEAGEPEIFIDPNAFSKDGTTRLAGLSFSKDGSLCAYQVSKGGADWNDALIIRSADKSIVEDTLKGLKFSSISWKGNTGYYYSKYDRPEGSHLSAKTQEHKLYFHRVGTPHSEDILVFGGKGQERRYVGGYLTEDERFLIVEAAMGTSGNELYIQDMNDPHGKLMPIVNNLDHDHHVIGNEGGHLWVETNLNAPNKRLALLDINNPLPEHWKDLIPETEHAMETSTAGGKIFASYLIDVKTSVKQFNLQGKLEKEIPLPGIGTATGFGGKRDEKEIYFTFLSFTNPPAIYKYSISSGESTPYEKPKVNFNPDDFETKQVFYPSKDGTKIPMYLVYKKGLVLNGKNPTMLYGYGGFNINYTPSFSPSRMAWLENGGIYAQPNLRGGGEYGEKWHIAGTKFQKQNVFDDFIGAAEYLIREKYTSSPYLAIAGGSNGGLLVGAVMTQRPDLMKVALPAVGVMDMLRYHQFTAGAGWAVDYGTAHDSKEMFEYLRKYSPLHALRPNTAYPATLVTTSDHDDRVVPAHSFKFAATLQANHQGENPVLIRIETKSGHGASNLSKAIELMSDQYAFAWYAMGYVPPLFKGDM